MQKPLELVTSFLKGANRAVDDPHTSHQVALCLTAGVDHTLKQWANESECYKLWVSYVSVLKTPLQQKVSGPGYRSTGDSFEEDTMNSMHRAIFNAAGNRRLFLTSQGRLGLGSSQLDHSALVVILHRCSMPVVLRRSRHGDDTYEFVGVCYVYGIMAGEAVEKHRAARGEDVVFTLV